MNEPEPHEITQLLRRWESDRTEVVDRLLPLVYVELERLARRRLRGERAGHTLQTGDLVHEAYLRLVDARAVGWQGRAHFFAVAARAMRRVLVDHARRKAAGKRVSPHLLVPLDETPEPGVEPAVDVVALDEALDRLAELDARQARVVELRAFVGLTLAETAEALEISPSTAYREWRTARLWLRRFLLERGAAPEGGDGP